MSGYRFCRTDDAELLVEAHNRCYAVHFPELAPMTLADFRRDTRELDLWASSCMVAFSGQEPIGVLLSAKRPSGSLVLRIGVHPDHQRHGHGAHLLGSLARKLAILGPPQLAAEIPLEWKGPSRFFEACGYSARARLADFVREGSPPPPGAPDAGRQGIVSVTLDEILDAGALSERPEGTAWERSPATLQNRKEHLEGWALAADRIEAFAVLGRASPTEREIVALGAAEGSGDALGVLVRHLCARSAEGLRVPRVSELEVAYPTLEAWGFSRAREYLRYVAESQPS